MRSLIFAAGLVLTIDSAAGIASGCRLVPVESLCVAGVWQWIGQQFPSLPGTMSLQPPVWAAGMLLLWGVLTMVYAAGLPGRSQRYRPRSYAAAWSAELSRSRRLVR